MANVEVKYILSEEGRKQSLLSGGNGKKEQIICIPFTEDIKDIVNVNSNGVAYANISEYLEYQIKETTFSGKTYNNKMYYEYHVSYDRMTKTFGKVLTVDEAKQELIKLNELRVENLKLREKLENEVKIKNEEYDRIRDLIQQEKDNKEAQLKKEREEAKKLEREEKENWIKEFGSQHLKDCFEYGYKYERIYAYERQKVEFEDFMLDYNDVASWSDRYNPSVEAMQEFKATIERVNKLKKDYKVRIVWANEIPCSEEDYIENECESEEIDKQEAIVVRNYLGKYDLIKLV